MKCNVDENQVETDSMATIQLLDPSDISTFSFGIKGNSKINIALDTFDWSGVTDIEQEKAAIELESFKENSKNDKIALLK